MHKAWLVFGDLEKIGLTINSLQENGTKYDAMHYVPHKLREAGDEIPAARDVFEYALSLEEYVRVVIIPAGWTATRELPKVEEELFELEAPSACFYNRHEPPFTLEIPFKQWNSQGRDIYEDQHPKDRVRTPCYFSASHIIACGVPHGAVVEGWKLVEHADQMALCLADADSEYKFLPLYPIVKWYGYMPTYPFILAPSRENLREYRSITKWITKCGFARGPRHHDVPECKEDLFHYFDGTEQESFNIPLIALAHLHKRETWRHIHQSWSVCDGTSALSVFQTLP